jgi:hypothetical protein
VHSPPSPLQVLTLSAPWYLPVDPTLVSVSRHPCPRAQCKQGKVYLCFANGGVPRVCAVCLRSRRGRSRPLREPPWTSRLPRPLGPGTSIVQL